MPTQTTIDGTVSVNDAIRLFPATVEVFNRFGIDACRGGAAPIAEAAARDGVEEDALLEALCEAARAGSGR